MVVQAGAERRALPSDSPTAGTLAEIEQQGRQTLTELRRLLGVLQADGAAPLTPQPGIGQLPELVHGCTAAGMAVTLRSVGDPRSVEDGVGMAVYRVVQEALTNVRKHSATDEATVTLHWGPRHVQVEIVDPGQARRRRLLPGSGLGLRAMRERVTTFGGTLSAGPTADGFRVLATLPVDAG
jgi:signal transduction histidine kinase